MWYEVDLISRWIRQTLAEDAQMQDLISKRVFKGIAPPNTPYPVILTRLVTARDVQWVGANRVKVDSVMSVHYVSDTMDTSELIPIATRADELMHGKSHVPVGDEGDILSSNRVEVNEAYQVQQATFYWSYIAIFEISAQARAT